MDGRLTPHTPSQIIYKHPSLATTTMTPTIVNADADPDPTTQMAWPNARHNTKGASESAAPDLAEYDGGEGDGGERSSSSRRTDGAGGKKRMSMMDLFNLSISMGGAQIAWTVELGYASNGGTCSSCTLI